MRRPGAPIVAASEGIDGRFVRRKTPDPEPPGSCPKSVSSSSSAIGVSSARQVCQSIDLPHVGSSLRVQVPGRTGQSRRNVLVARVATNEVAAMDARCFHANGPLELGDIEDVQGRLCVVCPVHHYRIDLRTGEWMYQGYDPIKKKGTGWKSGGQRHRVHKAWEQDGAILLELDVNAEALPSDKFAENADDFEDSEGDDVATGGPACDAAPSLADPGPQFKSFKPNATVDIDDID